MSRPCTRNCSDLNPGKACPACGHTSLAHSGVHNPALVACVICELQRDTDTPPRSGPPTPTHVL